MSENLILGVLAAIAGVLLVAGLIQALRTPSRRRLRRGRIRGGTRVRTRRGRAATAASAPRPSRAPARVPIPPQLEIPLASPPLLQAGPAPSTLPQQEVPPGPAPTPPPAALAPEPPLLKECFALYRAERYQELISTAEPQLRRASDSAGSAEHAHLMAGLWSLVGLSKQALSDDEGARAAFEAAIRVAPEAGQPVYQRYLAELVSRVGPELLERAETLGEDAEEERLQILRQAVLWLRRGLGAAPDDQRLSVSLDRAREALWAAYSRLASGLVGRLEFDRARLQILEALADEELPADRREAFMDLLSSTYAGEIEQLTAHAIRALQDGRESEALISLERAAALLSSTPDDALPPKRREEAHRRLWWGYSKLGLRRVEAREFEAALAPLCQALKLGPADPERQQEAREALVRALEAVADSRTSVIGRLLKDGKQDAALAEGDRLLALIREGVDAGLSDTEITAALTKTRRAIEQVQQR